MAAFKDPSFTDRQAAAARAKEAALAKLRAKPPVDEAVVAQRIAAAAAREAAAAAKREAVRLAREEEAAAKRERAARAAAEAEAEALAKAALVKPQMTEEERKAIRDARYAARKNRKK